MSDACFGLHPVLFFLFKYIYIFTDFIPKINFKCILLVNLLYSFYVLKASPLF